jgi:predicted acylesterase/phospholipase RssA
MFCKVINCDMRWVKQGMDQRLWGNKVSALTGQHLNWPLVVARRHRHFVNQLYPDNAVTLKKCEERQWLRRKARYNYFVTYLPRDVSFTYTHYSISQNNVTIIATRLQAGQPRNCGSIPDRGKRFLFDSFQTVSEAQQVSCSINNGFFLS